MNEYQNKDKNAEETQQETADNLLVQHLVQKYAKQDS